MNAPRWKRVLLKISGQSLGGDGGLNLEEIESIATQCRDVNALGVELIVVVGGGNFIRGTQSTKWGINRVMKGEPTGWLIFVE